jgi:hypothetical protein
MTALIVGLALISLGPVVCGIAEFQNRIDARRLGNGL